jgi:hypothetical protein
MVRNAYKKPRISCSKGGICLQKENAPRLFLRNYEYDAAEISKYIKAQTDELKKLPPDEARKRALESLMSSGIVDASGNVTAPYRNN